MLQLSEIEATHRTQLFKQLGSFWYSVFSDTDKVRKLVSLARKSRIYGNIESIVHNLAGVHEVANMVTFVNVGFLPSEIFETGTQLYQDAGFNYSDDFGTGTVYGQHQINYFVLPLSRVVPITIQSRTRKLLAGIDFFIVGRFIFFRQNPQLLFPEGSYMVERGIDSNYRSFFSYFTRIYAAENEDLIIKYFRSHQTPQFYRMALAAAGGLQILRSEQKLLEIIPNGTSTVYTFDDQVLIVDYPHDQLILGKTYPKYFIIGNGIETFQNTGDGNAWWRQVDWRGGLSLEPLLNVRGLNLIDRETVAYNAGQDTGSSGGNKVHARVRLSDDFYAEDKYWNVVAARETATGNYLNKLIGLEEEVDGGNPTIFDTFAKLTDAFTAANDLNQMLGLPKENPDVGALPKTELANSLDVFFQAVLGIRSMVIVLRTDNIKYPASVFDFIRREMPAGCTPVIFAYGPDFIEEVKFGDTIQTAGSVIIQAIDTLTVTETVNLANIESDYAIITEEIPV